ncbi:hypothetical protein [Wolbachia endosymbiont of Pentidionis agamae]|uniref:hypothetical protein n=1 Tax=Wolbachia endosymbiont of Pentidionis agamae TaxID=3110435 RepID=UPI002FD53E2D
MHSESFLQKKSVELSAISLFTQDHVKKAILELLEKRSYYKLSDEDWKKINEAAKRVVEELDGSEKFICKVKNAVGAIGLEIRAWLTHYQQMYCNNLAVLNSLSWNLNGKINQENTIRRLLQISKMGNFSKYKLTCIYCIEEEIFSSWEKLHPNTKNNLKKMKKENSLVAFWSYYISNRVEELIKDGSSKYEYGLKIAVKQGNHVATKYFWEKITLEEQEKNLKECFMEAAAQPLRPGNRSKISDEIPRFPESSGINNLLFFLRQLSVEQQKEIFKDNPIVVDYVLNCFIYFPYRNLFLRVAEYTLDFFDFLKKDKTYFLLLCIAEKIAYDPETYSKQLKYVWDKIPDKDSSINSFWFINIIEGLLHARSYENIKFILNTVSISVREKILPHYKIVNDCYYKLILQDEWNILRDLVQCCLKTKESVLKFKKELLNELSNKLSNDNSKLLEKKKKENKRYEICNFFDDIIASHYHGEEPRKKRKELVSSDDDWSIEPQRPCKIRERRVEIEDIEVVDLKKGKELKSIDKKRKHVSKVVPPESQLENTKIKRLKPNLEVENVK